MHILKLCLDLVGYIKEGTWKGDLGGGQGRRAWEELMENRWLIEPKSTVCMNEILKE